jgi:hypothetical protein
MQPLRLPVILELWSRLCGLAPTNSNHNSKIDDPASPNPPLSLVQPNVQHRS